MRASRQTIGLPCDARPVVRIALVSLEVCSLPSGLAQAVSDLASGRVDLVIAMASTALPRMMDARLNALAITTAKRSSLFPQLPTMAEAGVPGYDASTWYALLVPARTPAAIVACLNGELAKIAADAGVRKAFDAQGLETAHSSPEQARAHIRSEIEKWGKVVKAMDVKSKQPGRPDAART